MHLITPGNVSKNCVGNSTMSRYIALLFLNITMLISPFLFYYQNAWHSDMEWLLLRKHHWKQPVFLVEERVKSHCFQFGIYNSTLLTVFPSFFFFFLLGKRAFWLAWRLNMLPCTFYDLVIRNKLLHDLCYLMQDYWVFTVHLDCRK